MKNFFFFLSICFVLGCKKFLDKKSDARLNIPSTISELQALLDNPTTNKAAPGAGETSSDDYFLNPEDYQGREENIRMIYIWGKAVFKPNSPNNDWNNPYKIIYNSNLVLEHIDKIQRTHGDQESWNNTKGCALFLRGYNLQLLASLFTIAYNPATASTDPGLPLRLNPDFNEKSFRSSLKETYSQIINDLKVAAELLPVQPLHKIRPSKSAALAMLARVYLYMGVYDSALVYGNKCLALNDALMDYNQFNTYANAPFPAYGPEVLFHNIFNPITIKAPQLKVDTTLYETFDNNDLRKAIFFKPAGNQYTYKGSYDGTVGNFFAGIATDEVFLIKAECLARKGIIDEAMATLNKLLQKRWKNGVAYPTLLATSSKEALEIIIKERRKELVFRGLRWMDIKRYNRDGANIIPIRLINGKEYRLLPNSPRYAFPIPDDVITLSGIQQNP